MFYIKMALTLFIRPIPIDMGHLFSICTRYVSVRPHFTGINLHLWTSYQNPSSPWNQLWDLFCCTPDQGASNGRYGGGTSRF